jgi:hypothetical protein
VSWPHPRRVGQGFPDFFHRRLEGLFEDDGCVSWRGSLVAWFAALMSLAVPSYTVRIVSEEL